MEQEVDRENDLADSLVVAGMLTADAECKVAVVEAYGHEVEGLEGMRAVWELCPRIDPFRAQEALGRIAARRYARIGREYTQKR